MKLILDEMSMGNAQKLISREFAVTTFSILVGRVPIDGLNFLFLKCEKTEALQITLLF